MSGNQRRTSKHQFTDGGQTPTGSDCAHNNSSAAVPLLSPRKQEKWWLFTEYFHVTKSLVARIASLPKKEQSIFCFIQNKVVLELREARNPLMNANIGAKYFKEKTDNYTKYLRILVEWGELMINHTYCADAAKSSTGETFTKSYSIPAQARNSGIIKIDFRRKKRRAPVDKSTATGPIVDYQRACYQQLTVKDTFIEPQDSYRFNAVVRGLEAVSVGAANFSRGEKGNRLFHTTIMMPSEGRVNLAHKSGRKLGEGDMKSCHPFLLILLCALATEKESYARFVTMFDIYTHVARAMGIKYSKAYLKWRKVDTEREAFKEDFMLFYNGAQENYVYRYYAQHFPTLAAKIMDMGKEGMAEFLQNAEADIMINRVAPECMKRGLFFIVHHDGWLGLTDEAEQIARIVIKETERAVGFAPQIKFTDLETRTEQVFKDYSVNSKESQYRLCLSYVSGNGEHSNYKKPILSPFDRYKALEALEVKYAALEPSPP